MPAAKYVFANARVLDIILFLDFLSICTGCTANTVGGVKYPAPPFRLTIEVTLPLPD